jgi:hypothetical protein
MAMQQRYCTNHPQRLAIGVCVMTQRPICSECSTRYEGVNYSREGLQLLQAQRQAALAKGSWIQSLLSVMGWIGSPLLLYLIYLSYRASADVLMNLLHGEL